MHAFCHAVALEEAVRGAGRVRVRRRRADVAVQSRLREVSWSVVPMVEPTLQH